MDAEINKKGSLAPRTSKLYSPVERVPYFEKSHKNHVGERKFGKLFKFSIQHGKKTMFEQVYSSTTTRVTHLKVSGWGGNSGTSSP